MEARETPHVESPKPPRKMLVWLFVFLYLPFVWAHGFEAWSQSAYDFPPLYCATKAVFDQHQSPYGVNAFAQQSKALGRWIPPFLYPPPSLLVLYPLHLFSYDGAKACLLAINHLCLLAAILLITRRLFREEFARAPTQLWAALALVYLLSFDPTVVTLHLGQVNLLLLVCICFLWDALKRDRGALAIALPLSVAIVIKTYPILLLPLLVFRRRYKAVALTLAFFALYCAAAYALLPASVWSDWVSKVMPESSQVHPGPWNQNIRAFVGRAFLPNPFSDPLWALPQIVKPLIMLGSGAVFAATMLVSFFGWWRSDARRPIEAELSLYLLMIFLIAPVSWEHHFVYLLPSLILVLLLLLRGETSGHWRWILPVSLCLVGWRFPIAWPALTKGWWVLLISAKFYPAVALWVFFFFRTRMDANRSRFPAGASVAVADVALSGAAT
ncbi:MAG: DUF2029 domain-containing protein [Verrucomicrobiota bacterium]|nr:DUF2029 domain-containing protein [Verrucomicrobiota bacterium]